MTDNNPAGQRGPAEHERRDQILELRPVYHESAFAGESHGHFLLATASDQRGAEHESRERADSELHGRVEREASTIEDPGTRPGPRRSAAASVDATP